MSSATGAPSGILARLVRVAVARPLTTLLLALALAAAALFYVAGHIALNSDASALISDAAPWRAAEIRMDKAFPGNGDVIVVVIDGRTPELAEAAAAALAPRLAADTAHVRAASRADGGDYFGREGLLYLSAPDVRATTARMIEAQPFLGPLAADPSLRGIAGALGTMIEGVTRGQASLDRIETPMHALADALDARARGTPAFFSWQQLIGGGSTIVPTRQLITVRPRLELDALMPGAAASDAIRAAARRLALDPAHGVSVRLTGATPLSDEEFGSLAENWWQVALAMAGAMLLTLWLATRSARLTAAILITTLAGLIVTTALGLAIVGALNLISVAFIPLFVGLGVDFGIQLAVSFQAERSEGAPPAASFTAAAAAMGPSLLLAAGAVCLGFLAFLPTSYRGIAELGLIASIGMAVALVASATLLPALVTLVPPGRPRTAMGSARLAPLDAWLARRRKAILWSFALSMLASIALLPLVRFDFDPLHLRAQDSEAMATLAALMADPDRNPNTADMLVPDLPSARALAKRLEASPDVGRVMTIESFIPDGQLPKLAAIADAKALLDLTLDPIAPLPAPGDGEIVAALQTTATALKTVTGPAPATGTARRLAVQFDRLVAGTPQDRRAATDLLVRPLGTMLGQLRASLQAEPVTLETLPPEIVRDWIAPGGHYKVTAVPKAAWTDTVGLKRFGHAILAIDPHATGTAISTQGAAGTIADAFIIAGVIALAIVSALLYAALRDLREVAFTLAPVVLSGFLTLGTCVLIGQPINFANIIAFPLLFGVGVAFHIYFVMAWRSGATDLLQSSLARAVFFSALATGTAFGSLWLSHHPGTASMGKVLMLSLAWTLVCALIFEPALLGPRKAASA